MNNNLITHEEAARNFKNQIQFALNNYKQHGLQCTSYNNIVICGLGGSGIGGRLAMSYFKEFSSLPIEVVSGYDLPLYVNDKTLVIVSSYSGNTEETISLLLQAIKANAKCLSMSTGGAIKEISVNNKIYFLPIQVGYQPRMALGFSFSFLLLILSEFFNLDLKTTLQEITEKVEAHSASYEEKGKEILTFFSSQLENKFVLISGETLSSVAVRACQQIQENAKHEIFHHTLPECNHNTIETYCSEIPSNFLFLEGMNHERTSLRFNFLSSLLENNNCKVYKLTISEPTLYGIFELILILDWLSIHLSNEKHVDNMEVPNIMRLKEFLTEIK